MSKCPYCGLEPIRTISELEAKAIETALKENNQDLIKTAKTLGIGRATLYHKIKQYGLGQFLKDIGKREKNEQA